MRKLFQVRSWNGEEVLGNFDSRKAARAARKDGQKISRGPDHWRGPSRSDSEVERTRTIGKRG